MAGAEHHRSFPPTTDPVVSDRRCNLIQMPSPGSLQTSPQEHLRPRRSLVANMPPPRRSSVTKWCLKVARGGFQAPEEDISADFPVVGFFNGVPAVVTHFYGHI